MRIKSQQGVATVVVTAFLLVTLAVVLTRNPGLIANQIEPPLREPGTVESVIDGNTINVIDDHGQVTQVRILGVDAPSLLSDTEGGDCGAAEAASFLQEQLPAGAPIYLIDDSLAGEADRSGRLLRYVETKDGTDVGLAVISKGFGDVDTRDGPYGIDRAETYRHAATVALDHNRGLWATCEPSAEPS